MKSASHWTCALLFLICLSAGAQPTGANHDFFVGIGGGINLGLDTRKFESRDASHFGAGTAVDVYVGKWLGKTVGVRAGYLGYATSNRYVDYGGTQFHYLHADALFRLDPAFVPYAHVGYVRMDRGTVGAGIGALIPIHLGNNISIAPDFRMTILGNGAFEGVNMPTVNFSASLNLITRLNHNWKVFQAQDEWSTNKSWFAGVSLGINIGLDLQEMTSRVGSHAGAGTALSVYAGRWFSPHMGVRVGYLGGKTSNRFTEYNRDLLNYLYGDLLWRFQSWMVPYLHAGYAKLAKSSFAGGVGLMMPVYISKGVRIVPDVRFTLLDDRAFKVGSEKLGANLSATLGVVANLSKLQEAPEGESAMRYAVSTNLLDWINNGTINADFGISVAQHWSIHAAGRSNPWTFHYTADGERYRDIQYVASLGARWWAWYVYSGWWAGAKVQWANFMGKNILSNKLQDGRNATGLGLQGGYTLMLSKHLNLDFGLGVWGGALFRHEVYDAEAQTTRTYGGTAWFIAPDSISISLMYVF